MKDDIEKTFRLVIGLLYLNIGLSFGIISHILDDVFLFYLGFVAFAIGGFYFLRCIWNELASPY